jgi:hypothetical protein
MKKMLVVVAVGDARAHCVRRTQCSKWEMLCAVPTMPHQGLLQVGALTSGLSPAETARL